MDREINFKPLTDGLGFHPFADGLPYAPASKSTPTKPSGTGAVAAGRPQFAYPAGPGVTNRAPTPTSVLPSMPIDGTAEKIRRELESIQAQRLDQARAAAARKQDAQAQLVLHYGLDYSFQRAFAYLLDSAFNLSICASVLSTALLSTDLENLRDLSPLAVISVAVFLFACNWALLAAQEVAFGTTIGKRIFGLRLRGTGFECFVRALFFLPSLLFGGLGIGMSIFDGRKRCWHDRMTKLQPTE